MGQYFLTFITSQIIPQKLNTDFGKIHIAHKLSKAFQYNYLQYKTHRSEIRLNIQAKLSEELATRDAGC